MEEYLHKELTSKIIEGFYRVYNSLRFGFLEKVYENAFKYELELMNLKVDKQKPIDVH
jgi:GxxExxY protein